MDETKLTWGPTIGPGWDAVSAVAKALIARKTVRVLADGKWIIPDEWHGVSAAQRFQICEEIGPREAWVNVYDGESTTWFTKEEADGEAWEGRIECIHVREVID